MKSKINNQKSLRTRPDIIKDYLRVALSGAVIMTLLIGYPVLSSIIFALFRFIPIPIFNSYVWQVISMVVAAGILWCVYALLGVKRPIVPAALIATLCISIIYILQRASLNVGIIFLILLVATCAAYFVATRVRRTSVLWGIVGAAILFSMLIAPRIASYIDHIQYEDKTSKQLQAARANLDFDVYAPSYTPKGMKVSAPELFGIDSKYIRLHAEYTIGGIEVRQSERLNGQEQLMNFTDNCDISTLWFDIADNDGVSPRDVERSRSNLSKCVPAATTENGRKIYFQQRGQWARFYVEIGNTITMLEFDDLNRTKYEESFLPEMVKIVNSLQPVPKDKIEYGRH